MNELFSVLRDHAMCLKVRSPGHLYRRTNKDVPCLLVKNHKK